MTRKRRLEIVSALRGLAADDDPLSALFAACRVIGPALDGNIQHAFAKVVKNARDAS